MSDQVATNQEAAGKSAPETDNVLRYGMLLIFVLVPFANFILPPILSDGNRFADDPQTRVAAAGYAFAIWGVIFTGMLLFSTYLVLGSEPSSKHLRIALICLLIAGAASIAFVPISVYASQTIGWIDILFHLVPLAIGVYHLRLHATTVEQSSIGRWSFFGPSMYFGWICAASVISTALMANELGVELGESPATFLATIVVVVLTAIGAWFTILRDPVYGATVCWALIAVGVKQEAFPIVRNTAWIMAALLGLLIAIQLSRPGRKFYAVKQF